MITETKEELVAQLTRAWDCLLRAEQAFAVTIAQLSATHKNLRRYIARRNDTRPVSSVTLDPTDDVESGTE